MTPTQRKKHVAALKQLCENYGFKEDAYGNFLYPRVSDFRIKFKKVNVRFEHKSMGTWVSARYSEVISQLTIEKFEMELKHKVGILRDRVSRLEEAKPKPVKVTESVPLFGEHMNDPKVQAEVKKLIEERNHCDYQCFLILQKLLDLGLIIPPSSPKTYMDIDDYTEDEFNAQEDAAKMVAKRIDINDKFMKKVAGR